jgi:VWFA-related protein
LKKSTFFAFTLAIAAFLILGVYTSAQTATPQAQQKIFTKPLQIDVSVVLKLIHVYVADKKGKPVPDLMRNDFSITDNGTPVTITEFEEHSLGPSKGEPVPSKVPKAATQQERLEGPDVRPVARKFILFFDMAFNTSRGIAKAKEAANHFVDMQVRPEDEIAVISYSTFGGIKVHEFLTKDHSKARDAVVKIDQGGLTGRAEEIEDRYWRIVSEYEAPMEGSNERRLPSYVYEAMAEREQLKGLTRTFVLSLTTLAKALRAVPGQKPFILFSSGIPSSVIYGNQAGGAPASPSPRASGMRFDPGDSKLKAMNEAMYKEFAASGCTFYAFDTRESNKGMDLFGYDDLSRRTGVSVLGTGAPAGDSSSIFRDSKVTGVNFLKRFSDLTGGRYFSNIDRYKMSLEQVQALSGTYYVLGYPIEERWDGRFHDVRIEVKRKGCEVRTPAGYFNPKPFSEYTKLEKELHLYDLALNERAFSRLPVNVPMTSLVYGDGAGSRLGIVAQLPGAVTEKLAGGRIEFVAIFFDGEGEIREVVRAETDPAAYRGRAIIFTASTELEPGTYSCRLAARDMGTGLSAVASAVATVGTPQAAGLRLSTPLILTEGASGSYLAAGPLKKKDPLALAEVYTYDRSRFSPVIVELPQGAVSLRVIVPYSMPGEIEPDLAISAYMIDAKSGGRTPVSFSRIERLRSGPQGLLAFEIPVAGLTPGTYYLHFHAEDRVSRSISHTFTTLTVSQR